LSSCEVRDVAVFGLHRIVLKGFTNDVDVEAGSRTVGRAGKLREP
jgi:hypothetical protein